MRQVAIVVVALAFGLIGCGKSGNDPDSGIIIGDDDDDGGGGIDGGLCNPVEQTGCGAGQKCSYIVDQLDPELGHVGCVAEGPDGIGEACTDAMAVGDSDSCAKGGYCYNDTCREICTILDDQCTDGQCGDFVDAMGNPFPLEWCLFGCDPLTQDCASDNESCYLSDGEGICLRRVDEVVVGDACTYTNDCAEGGQCFGDPGVCRQLCGAIDQIWGVDGDGLLTWPLCCGTNCTDATAPCSLPNDMCWLVSDGTPDGVANIGICLDQDDASNPDATMPWTCDCSLGTDEKCALN